MNQRTCVNKIMKSILISIFILFIFIFPVSAATYYVTHDAAGGGDGSWATPWTIIEGFSSAVAGDIVKVQGGTYVNVHPIVGASGTSGNQIQFIADNGTPVLDGTDDTGYGIYSETKSYFVVDGFEIYDYNEGMHITSNSEHNEINNNTVHSNGAVGIAVGSTGCFYNNFSYNTIHSNGVHGLGLMVASWSNVTENTIYSNDGSGIYVVNAKYCTLTNNDINDTSGTYYDYEFVSGSSDTIIIDTIKSSNYYELSTAADPLTIRNGVDYNITVTETTVFQDNPTSGVELVNLTIISGTIGQLDVSSLTPTTSYQLRYSNSTVIEYQDTDGAGAASFTSDLSIANDYLIMDASIPSNPYNLSYTQGNFWVNYTWESNTGIESYNVSINGSWTNGSTNTYSNNSTVLHGSIEIIVYGYSLTNDTLSLDYLTNNVTMSNNPVTITDVSTSYSLNKGETFVLDANYTDLDNDPAVFTDNSSDWNIDSATGEVSWLTTSDDVGTHSYRVTVDDGYGSTDYQDFTVTVNDPIEVLSTDPTGDFDLDANDAQELSAELNFNATVVWYVNEIETQTEYNTTTPDYYFTSLEEGEHNVTFVATDPINGTSDSFTWLITVIDEDIETPSVHIPQPRRDRPVTETIERYIPGFWDDYGGVEEVVEEVEEVFTTEIPDKNLWWLVLLLTILLLISYYYKEE